MLSIKAVGYRTAQAVALIVLLLHTLPVLVVGENIAYIPVTGVCFLYFFSSWVFDVIGWVTGRAATT